MIKLTWYEMKSFPRFRFATATLFRDCYFDEVDIGLIGSGRYKDKLFVAINVESPYMCDNGTVELLDEEDCSYEGINRYIRQRGFCVSEPIDEDAFNESLNALKNKNQ